jgi:Fe-S-cluster containining protein
VPGTALGPPGLACERAVLAPSSTSVVQMSDHKPLDCLKCRSFCCKMAGYVRASRSDIRRLAKFLDLTVREFEERHVLEVTRKGEKLIKPGYDTCQFLGADRSCTVYEARPKDCREYVCWDQDDSTVYEFARFFQLPVAGLRKAEKESGSR